MCRKVLIVDDDSSFVYSIMNKYIENDMSISTAESLSDALIKIKNNIYDVILANTRIPGGDSYCLKKELGSVNKAAKVIFMSGLQTDCESYHDLGEECLRKSEIYGKGKNVFSA